MSTLVPVKTEPCVAHSEAPPPDDHGDQLERVKLIERRTEEIAASVVRVHEAGETMPADRAANVIDTLRLFTQELRMLISDANRRVSSSDYICQLAKLAAIARSEAGKPLRDLREVLEKLREKEAEINKRVRSMEERVVEEQKKSLDADPVHAQAKATLEKAENAIAKLESTLTRTVSVGQRFQLSDGRAIVPRYDGRTPALSQRRFFEIIDRLEARGKQLLRDQPDEVVAACSTLFNTFLSSMRTSAQEELNAGRPVKVDIVESTKSKLVRTSSVLSQSERTRQKMEDVFAKVAEMDTDTDDEL